MMISSVHSLRSTASDTRKEKRNQVQIETSIVLNSKIDVDTPAVMIRRSDCMPIDWHEKTFISAFYLFTEWDRKRLLGRKSDGQVMNERRQAAEQWRIDVKVCNQKWTFAPSRMDGLMPLMGHGGGAPAALKSKI